MVVALVVFGSLLIGLYLWSASTLKATTRSDWSQAHMAYEQQMSLTQHFPQPWLSQYNLGTVLVDEGRLDEGLVLLESALRGVPKARVDENGSIGAFSYECSVRFNLSAAVELTGDLQVSNGEEGAALQSYERALELVGPCQIAGSSGQSDESQDQQDQQNQGGPGGESSQDEDANSQFNPEMDQQTGESADRLKEKIEELRGPSENPSEPGEDDGGSGDQNEPSDGGSGTGDETPQERERREELEAKNREQEERQREKEESYNRNPGSGGW